MIVICEYDLDIKTTTIVKGQGLYKLEVEAQDQTDEGSWENEVSIYTVNVLFIPTNMESSYYELKYYLKHGYNLNHLDAKRRRALRLKYTQYKLINGILFRKNYDGVLLRCLEESYVKKFLVDLNDGLVARHFLGDTHHAQSIKGWVLLIDIVQGCTCTCA
jgi:hypothetical protein